MQLAQFWLDRWIGRAQVRRRRKGESNSAAAAGGRYFLWVVGELYKLDKLLDGEGFGR